MTLQEILERVNDVIDNGGCICSSGALDILRHDLENEIIAHPSSRSDNNKNNVNNNSKMPPMGLPSELMKKKDKGK